MASAWARAESAAATTPRAWCGSLESSRPRAHAACRPRAALAFIRSSPRAGGRTTRASGAPAA
eukprot:scaffold74631_cov29-Phaeocystis_antarctica.AAC.1